MPSFRQGIFAILGCSILVLGCNQPQGNFKTAKQIQDEKKAAGHSGTADPDDHDHGAGPHGGAIVELGDEEYHGEVVVDGKTHQLTVYLLGKDAKTPAPVEVPHVTVVTEDNEKLQLTAVAAAGSSAASEFVLQDEAKVDAIVKAGYLHGSLQVDIKGKPYRGDIDAHFDGSTHDEHEMPAKEDAAAPTQE